MPATSKAELQAVTTKEFAKLLKLMDDVEEHKAMTKDEEDTSIKDVIAHRAHWIDLFLGWYHDGLAGKKVFFPAPGYKWNELKRYNAELRKEQADVDWLGARTMLIDANEKLVAFISQCSEQELYGGPMAGADNKKWTPGRWAEAAGPSHYRSAVKYLRAARRRDVQT